MKNFALAMIATTLLGWANYAQANGYIFNSCSSTVSADSGTTGRVYNETAATYCSCADYANAGYCTMEGGFSCTLPYELKGWSPAGLNCCVDLRSLCLVGDIKTAVVESIQSLNKDGIADAFAPNSGPYWGYANTTNRTGNYGRDVSIKARLDVCMGSNDTDSAIATNNATTCYNQYCGTSSNEYCNASGSDGGWSGAGAVCHDRCECAINGTTHSSCNQL